MGRPGCSHSLGVYTCLEFRQIGILSSPRMCPQRQWSCDAPGDQGLDLSVGRRIDPPELGALCALVIAALEKEHVIVDVEVEGSTESLDEGNGAGLECRRPTRSGLPLGDAPALSIRAVGACSGLG